MGKKRGFFGSIAVGALNRVLVALPKRTSLRLQHYWHHRSWPDLDRPRTFNEKTLYRKLHDCDPRLAPLSDKIAAKIFAAEKLGPEWVTPTLWSGTQLPPRSERNWPVPYVIKSNHGSGTNIFILSEDDKDWPRIERETAAWLKARYKPHLFEEHYHRIVPQLLVEPFIGTGEMPIDYKFFVFDGRAEMVVAYVDRSSDLRTQPFSRDWTPLPFAYYRPLPDRLPDRPGSYAEMLAAAELLGKGFSFVRVDFYEVEGRPRFGEMTFMAGSGIRRFDPVGYDLHYGQLWPDKARST